MKTVKVKDLTGPALDYAVSVVEGVTVQYSNGIIVVFDLVERKGIPKTGPCIYEPTQSWQQCGPLIERYNIEFCNEGSHIYAELSNSDGSVFKPFTGVRGENHLEAACRAIVLSTYEFINIPKELL